MGEVLFQDRLHRRGVNAQVLSAGLVSNGVPASANGVRAMADRGLDLSRHRSTPLAGNLVSGADLVIGMAREHVREAVLLEQSALGRTFTLKEIVRRAETVGPRRIEVSTAGEGSRPSIEPFGSWLERLGSGRVASDLLGSDDIDDVEDPMGQSRRAYNRTAEEIEDLVDRFMAMAFPSPAPGSGSAGSGES